MHVHGGCCAVLSPQQLYPTATEPSRQNVCTSPLLFAAPGTPALTFPRARHQSRQHHRTSQRFAAATWPSPGPEGQPAQQAASLYSELGVTRAATKLELKKAYRQKALQFHPDVNPSEDATAAFVRLSRAYEVLMDDQQRAAYDKYGLAGLESGWESRATGSAAWDAFDTWDEFKPFKRRTRRGDARDAAAERTNGPNAAAAQTGNDDGHGALKEAHMGDVVEYPLSPAVMDRCQDGRTKGVGFVVGRNKDRGDSQKLPPENVSLVEIEPLFFDSMDELWRADPLESSAFARLEDLRVLSSEFNRKSDSWTIRSTLSAGCGSPIYEEEVIL